MLIKKILTFFIKLLLAIIFIPFKLYFLTYKNFKIFIFSHLTFISVVFISFYFLILKDLPEISNLQNYQPSLESIFLDKDKNFMYSISEEKRIYVEIENIPQNLKNAFLAAEDKDFYIHKGIDFEATIKRGISDIFKILSNQKLAGGSTITQQVVRNILLTKERTIRRKIKEVILSYRITKLLSKDEIFEIYLNHIFLGNKAFGVAAAAEVYFDKKLKDLTIDECAILASLPKAPSSVNPFKHPMKSKKRRNWILYRMMIQNFITKDEYESYAKKDLNLKKPKQKDETAKLASWFAKKNFTEYYNLTEEDFSKGGFTIQTTIDKDLQKIAQNALDFNLINIEKKVKKPFQAFSNIEEIDKKNWKEELKKIPYPENICHLKFAIILNVEPENLKIGYKEDVLEINKESLDWIFKKDEILDKKKKKNLQDVFKKGDVVTILEKENTIELAPIPTLNGGVVIIDSSSGEILTMVGGFCDIPATLNRATDAIRQTGSAIKPFIYAAGLENGMLPSKIFMDVDVEFQNEDGTVWSPNNWNKKNLGPTTLRYGLEKSKNTITVALTKELGLKKAIDLLKKLQLSKEIEYDLSITLGTLHTSLLNFTRAYAIFANKGILPELKLIKKIKQSKNLIKDDAIVLKGVDLKPETNYKTEETKEVIKLTEDETSEIINQETKEESSINENDFQIISPQTAYQILSMLKGSIERGTSSILRKLNLNLGAKTGTSDKGKDLWMFFVSKKITGGVFIGADIPIENDNFYGSTIAGSVIHEILKEVRDKNLYQINLPKTPSGLKFLKINSKTGKRINGAYDKENVYIIDEIFKEEDDISSIKSEKEEGGQYTIEELVN